MAVVGRVGACGATASSLARGMPVVEGNEGRHRRMAYLVRAIHADGVTGTFTAEMNTRRSALESAKRLRKQGLLVSITDPDGKEVDETEGK
jgi:hypothetical protein